MYSETHGQSYHLPSHNDDHDDNLDSNHDSDLGDDHDSDAMLVNEPQCSTSAAHTWMEM